MSPIGRIFIVLNLILSACFFAAASSQVTQGESWKEKHDDAAVVAATKQAELEDQISALRLENDTKSTEASAFRDERNDAQAARDRVAAENARLVTQVSEASAANTANAGKLSDIEAVLSSNLEAKDAAVSAQRDAERERDNALSDSQDAATLAQDLTAKNSALGTRINTLEAQLAQLTQSNSSLETQLATLVDVTGVSLADIRPSKLINGSVLQAVYDVAPGLVALNVGSNDGVKRGTTFEIYNGLNYKGQVRVENVRDDMCTALILRVEAGQEIASGDKAATRL